MYTLQIIGCISSFKIHFWLRRTIVRNSHLTFVCCIFPWRKRLKNSCNLDPLFWICQITFPLALPTIFIQMSFIWIWLFLHWHPPLHLHHFEEFILIILDNITMCSSQPNKDKKRIMKPHENKISIIEISK